jgi:GT2 family glycosyltransferase
MWTPYIINVVLHFNRIDDTIQCLQSIYQSTYNNYKTIVLDYNSPDEALEAIRILFPQIEIIHLEENRGYAGNNNVGIAAAIDQGADWVFVLNNDTILAPDCLSCLVEIGTNDSRIGILGPMVYHHDEPNIIQSAGGMLGPCWDGIHLAKNELDSGQFDELHFVEWVSGCAILIRRQVIEEVSAFDPRFFLYWEETDLCMRAGKAGWRIVHVPKAKIWHKGVQREYHPSPAVIYYLTRNRLLLLAIHHAPIQVWIASWVQMLRTLISWSIKPKWRDKHELRIAMWKGMLDYLHHNWGQMRQ